METKEFIEQIKWIGMCTETQSILIEIGQQCTGKQMLAIDFSLGMGKVMVYDVNDLENGRSFSMDNLDNAKEVVITEIQD